MEAVLTVLMEATTLGLALPSRPLVFSRDCDPQGPCSLSSRLLTALYQPSI